MRAGPSFWEIHRAGVAEFAARLQHCGLTRIPDGVEVYGVLPMWHFQVAPRYRVKAAERQSPRDIVIRLDGPDAADLKVFGTRSGVAMTSLGRSLAYMLVHTTSPYVQVSVGHSDKDIEKLLWWRSLFQTAALDTKIPGGIRTAAEVLTAICDAQRLPVDRARFIPPATIIEDPRQPELPLGNPSHTTRN